MFSWAISFPEITRPHARWCNLSKRRARDSNPQPRTGHFISNEAASHSLTLPLLERSPDGELSLPKRGIIVCHTIFAKCQIKVSFSVVLPDKLSSAKNLALGETHHQSELDCPGFRHAGFPRIG